MNYLHSDGEVVLTLWETDPRKRNVNNEVCLSVHDSINVGVGDCVLGSKSQNAWSAYEITEILEQRPSSIKKRLFVRAKTKWYMMPEEIV